MNSTTVTRFRDLAIGQSFDFIDDSRPGFNSFFDRVQKVSARMYVSLRHPEYRYRVGSIDAQVFHVEATEERCLCDHLDDVHDNGICESCETLDNGHLHDFTPEAQS